MYPLADDRLPLDRVAETWSRCIEPAASQAELQAELLRAAWRGELCLYYVGQKAIPRRVFIDQLVRDADHAKILIAHSAETLPPEQEEHADGSVTVDLRPRLFVPPDLDQLTPESIRAACTVIAGLDLDVYPPTLLARMEFHALDRKEFGVLCDARAWPRPPFWFSQEKKFEKGISRKRARQIVEFRAWFSDQIVGERRSRSKFWSLARSKFNELLKADFDSAWAVLAPAAWSEPGAFPSMTADH
jgi:hypothetical protein